MIALAAFIVKTDDPATILAVRSLHVSRIILIYFNMLAKNQIIRFMEHLAVSDEQAQVYSRIAQSS